MRRLLILCCSLAAALSPARAVLLGYWDFNGSYARTDGTMGSLDATLEGFGIDYQNLNGEGSVLNLVPPSLPDTSLKFFSLATINEVGHITVTGLNFTGYTAPAISFAARNSPVFQIGDQFYVEYKIGAGAWTKAADLAAPDAPFQLVSYTFLPDVLDNQSDVGIRVTFSTVVEVVDTFEFDNLQINAVPEPGSAVLAVAGLALGGLVWRGRKRA